MGSARQPPSQGFPWEGWSRNKAHDALSLQHILLQSPARHISGGCSMHQRQLRLQRQPWEIPAQMGMGQGGDGAEHPVPVSDPSSSSTPELEHLHGAVQSKGAGLQTVRWLQESGAGSHLAGHTLFCWPHSSPVSPKLSPERALQAQVTTGQPHVCCKAIHDASQPGQAARSRSCCLVSHRAREAHGEKRKVSTVPGGANTCCQRADPAAQH